ncbi:MAG: PLP-dependent transferase, partial [Pirellulaceae bacterium]|nr:PLP-dependent transferase [Pirellulaceae bacterium]
LFCEFPGNPTLHSPDLQRLRTLADRYDFPIVVDDTIGTFANVSVLPIADAVTSSLTKHFSGVGDVMAGSLVLNPQQRFFEPLKTWLEADDAAFLYAEDAERLEANSRDFSERMVRFNANGETFCDWLQEQPQIARVCYPKYQTDDAYDRCRRDGGGYGSLCSVIFENEAVSAPRFFDAVRVNKGPSLGTNYTLICPYTILAHYHELEFAEASGVSRYLVRVSIGLEDVDDLKSRFTAALA